MHGKVLHITGRPYAIKNQRGASKIPPSRGLWMRRAGSLWHKRAGASNSSDLILYMEVDQSGVLYNSVQCRQVKSVGNYRGDSAAPQHSHSVLPPSLPSWLPADCCFSPGLVLLSSLLHVAPPAESPNLRGKIFFILFSKYFLSLSALYS